MKRRFRLLFAAFSIVIAAAGPPDSLAINTECLVCHPAQANATAKSLHSTLNCAVCHEGTADHLTNVAQLPKVHFSLELCGNCHPDQYRSFLEDIPGKTFYGGSSNPPDLWPKTLDFPYWNLIIDGHPFVIETYEDRAMKYNQIDAQATLRPMAEACLTCHGTKVAYYTGIEGVGNFPARTRTIQNTQQIWSGNFLYWQKIQPITIPAGTTVSSYVDTVNPPLHQMKSVVKLPDGRIYASYDYPNATATGTDADPAKATEARNYVWAALEALALDGLDPIANQASIDAGVLCNMCHDPHAAKLRIIQKPLIWSIAQWGISPYSPSGSQVKDFGRATRQDQIIAVCGQCHAEYVGGYSAVDRVNRYFFPWGKPAEAEALYAHLFDQNQDWIHGKGVRPWQNTDPGKPGYYPGDILYPLNEKLIKSQHPEAEVFWNSRMYNGGVACTDCHAPKVRNAAGQSYTSHFFASPVKYIKNKGVDPCAKCHMMCRCGRAGDWALTNIKGIQDDFYFAQEKAQVAIANSLKGIDEAKVRGENVDARITLHKRAHFRWEYYSQAENSMGFHHWEEATDAVNTAREDARVASGLPLPALRLAVASTTPNSISLSWYDQASDETGFLIERRDSGTAPFVKVARIESTNGSGTGTVAWTDHGLAPGALYTYRVAVLRGLDTSIYTLPATGTTLASTGNAPQAPSQLRVTMVGMGSIALAWQDNADDENGFYVERSTDSGASWTRIGQTGSSTTTYRNSGLPRRTTFWYRVQAFNTYGTSSYSGTVSAKAK